jgi:hypothetical protein
VEEGRHRQERAPMIATITFKDGQQIEAVVEFGQTERDKVDVRVTEVLLRRFVCIECGSSCGIFRDRCLCPRCSND